MITGNSVRCGGPIEETYLHVCEPQAQIKTKDLKMGANAKPRKRREQNDRAIRGILGKINTRLKDSTLTREEWLGLVKDAVQLAKSLGMTKNAKKGIPSATQRSESNLF